MRSKHEAKKPFARTVVVIGAGSHMYNLYGIKFRPTEETEAKYKKMVTDSVEVWDGFL